MAEPAAAARAQIPRWRVRHLLRAPHRLGFFLGTLVLLAAGGWWAAVQLMRAGLGAAPAAAVPVSLVHAAAMTFGFMPLFFAGFLFTAVPKWLRVPPPPTGRLAAPLLAQAAGAMAWLAGSHVHRLAACAGLAVATAGLVGVTVRYARMLRASAQADRLHAGLIGLALAFGCVCLAAAAASTAAGWDRAASAWVRSGFWGFVVMVFLCVSHRLIPFFTCDAFPTSRRFGASWSLWAMLGLAALEAAAELLDAAGGRSTVREVLLGAVEWAAGAGTIWLCVRWGRTQNLAVRWVGMLHLGFVWLGLALVLGGAARLLSAQTGAVHLPLGALHAVAMGSLGSLMLAMVARISMAHSGRPVRAEGLLTGVFRALQVATLLRLAATLPWPHAQGIIAFAALAWFTLTLFWGTRHVYWYGLPRADGRPG
ncbi:NnrS family protein [Variovorax sp. EBFNA2]|uniref:NnrS family protein n=1 Tax=Variovorax sp. EBFNA2 TaxID=3342097 RepID=UPI0029C0BACB|nr:NnrS family protein [Variovorax boronicumulans]WPG41005.1 NnrS family protein [Variovorax boronicumulans]